jgi:hypothetical protein
MERNKMGLAVIINNLDQEQTPTKKDVEAMGQVLKTIGGYFHFIFILNIFSILQVLMFKSTKT